MLLTLLVSWMAWLMPQTTRGSAGAVPLPDPDHGGFVTTLGRDTVAVERFTWTKTGLRGEVIQTAPVVTRATYAVTFGPNGAPTDYLTEIHLVNDTAPAIVIHTVVGTDSIRFTRTQGTTSKYAAAPAESTVYPENLYYWALYELQARAMVKAPGDSVPFRMVSAGGAKPYTTVFRRRSADTLSTKFFYPEYWMNYIIDPSGRLLAVDGSHTTIKILAKRQADAPVEAFLASASAHERSSGAVGSMSRGDSVTATDGDLTMSVAYSRPEVRGRQIWGGIVPFGAVWRTGANSATRIHISAPVEIGGTAIPAGNYTLFSLPTANGAQLIFNKQVGQWGTEYHEERDFARVPVKIEHLGSKVEVFTIRFGSTSDSKQNLILEWDDTRWTAAVKRP